MTTPTLSELVDRLSTEADLCRAETADDIANLLDEAAAALRAQLREGDKSVQEHVECPYCRGVFPYAARPSPAPAQGVGETPAQPAEPSELSADAMRLLKDDSYDAQTVGEVFRHRLRQGTLFTRPPSAQKENGK